MGRGIALMAFFVSLSGFGAVEYVRIPCDEQFQKVTWHDFVAQEKALGEAFNKIVHSSGTQVPTNCTTEYPQEHGQPVYGARRVILDVQWIAGGVFQQHGLKIDYDLLKGTTGNLRRINGVQICRNPEMCKKMGIPFGGAVVTPFPPPGPGPTPGR